MTSMASLIVLQWSIIAASEGTAFMTGLDEAAISYNSSADGEFTELFSEYNSATAPATRMTRAESADIQIINVLLFISPTHFCGKVRQYGVKPIKYKDTQYFT